MCPLTSCKRETNFEKLHKTLGVAGSGREATAEVLRGWSYGSIEVMAHNPSVADRDHDSPRHTCVSMIMQVRLLNSSRAQCMRARLGSLEMISNGELLKCNDSNVFRWGLECWATRTDDINYVCSPVPETRTRAGDVRGGRNHSLTAHIRAC